MQSSISSAVLCPPSTRFCTATSTMLALVISILSVIPGEGQSTPSTFVWIINLTPAALQKLMHVCLYAAFSLFLAGSQSRRRVLGTRLWRAALSAAALGAVLEGLQLYVPGRFGTLTDILLNAIGAALGVALGSRMLRSAD